MVRVLPVYKGIKVNMVSAFGFSKVVLTMRKCWENGTQSDLRYAAPNLPKQIKCERPKSSVVILTFTVDQSIKVVTFRKIENSQFFFDFSAEWKCLKAFHVLSRLLGRFFCSPKTHTSRATFNGICNLTKTPKLQANFESL